MRLLGCVIVHLLAVAMISRDECLASGREDRLFDTGYTTIQCFDGAYCGLKITGMADHVAVSKIDDNELV
jgi:hypothetical protein